MAQNLDLLKIAQEEQNGDLFKMLDGIPDFCHLVRKFEV